jgi:hypothetical protein
MITGLRASTRGAARACTWFPLFLLLVIACAPRPKFPTGGDVRASGHCEFDDTPHDPDSPTSAPPSVDGYGYEFAGHAISLFFEDGILTQFEVAEWGPPETSRPPNPHHTSPPHPRPVERWRKRGCLHQRAVEGRWYDVTLSAVSPHVKGKVVTGRVRFRGPALDVTVGGSEYAGACLWD